MWRAKGSKHIYKTVHRGNTFVRQCGLYQVHMHQSKWEGNRDVDVTKLGALEKQLLIDKLIKHVENDNLRLLQKQRERLDRVNVTLPTIEVRYMNLCVEAECDLDQGKTLPTLWNAVKSMFSNLQRIAGLKSRKTTVHILKDVSGIIKPSRLTLLLGPPHSGKTTLLQALAGRLGKSLKVTGEISYNGFRLEEFVPEKTSVYISQYDQHFPEMTVRETLDFSARLQGVGSRAETMKEVVKREKQAGIIPEPDIDTYMKAISEIGLKRNLQTDYILKILGLDICADMIVGDAMRRGISGGQTKRLTIGEMLVGPSKTLFMDEITNGLDSSTTYQTITCLQQLAHITNGTVIVSLLQAALEIFELFDDIILMSEGKIVYHGPRTEILNFFEECGFRCPERKDVADFLQEVLSRKDQEQYWLRNENYSYFTVDEMSEKFKLYHIGQVLDEDLLKPYDKSKSHKNALYFKNSFPNWEILKACMSRELLLMKRNLIIYIFKTSQLLIMAIITMTVFLRTRMGLDVLHADYYLGSLFLALMLLVASGSPEMALTVSKLPIFYKQRDMYLYPAWAYAIPASILKIPISLIDSLLWTSLTYYVIGYSPEVVRFLRQFLLLFLLHQMQLSIFRSFASFFQSAVASSNSSSFSYLAMTLFSGFILPLSSTPAWLKWGFWGSPLAYAEIGLSVNEFLAARWQEVSTKNGTVGQEVLRSHGLDFKGQFYWISVAALFGFTVLFNVVFALCLTFKRSLGESQYNISQKNLSWVEKKGLDNKTEQDIQTETSAERNGESNRNGKGRIVLPFVPLAITFQDVQYYVDTPLEMREQGYTEKKLQLLHDITGAFRPGVLSALMGVSGAGKTTLLDVLAGRKTGGTITGQIKISGYPKVQETFSRISGYCEQSDIHSPHITVEESLLYSAWLRLPADINPRARHEFVKEVLETIELARVKDALVGIPRISGLCAEQRKRLTIAVELVSNPSILFMDEPTTGLDAQAAATIMRAIKNVAETGRTVVCTIHQPSTNIFEAFNEIILMKRGGKIIYSGPLGQHSSKAIDYFEDIPGVPRMRHNCNPATWMLEVTSTSVEAQLGIDFAHIYKDSNVYRVNKEMVDQLSIPPPHSMDLNFSTGFPQNGWEQFKACLWKQHLSYWRTPSYNLVRIVFTIALSVILAALFWKHGKHINNQQDLFNMLGLLYVVTIFPGINNCAAIQPFVAIERIVLYRERFAGMYSPWAYSFAQVVIEIPYALLQVVLFVVITYQAVGLVWSAFKFFWFVYSMFCTLLYFIYLGMLVVSLTPNLQMASITSSACYALINLFSGFIIPGPQIPKWWIWLYYINPLSWTLNGLFTSQYGDIDKEIIVFGETKSIASFLPDYFGFHHDYLRFTAVLLMAFPLIFASLFAYCIGKINFQRR